MENPKGTSEGSAVPSGPRREIRLERAAIEAGGAGLRRTARFTDGTEQAVEMLWKDVRRVAAFRRDVLTSPAVCIAVTDAKNVVVLDEAMEGWGALMEVLPGRLALSPGFGEWRGQIAVGSAESYWTVLFRG